LVERCRQVIEFQVLRCGEDTGAVEDGMQILQGRILNNVQAATMLMEQSLPAYSATPIMTE
jgi:hypothetical protein